MTCVIYNLTSASLEIVLVSMQDRYTVCVRNYFGRTRWYSMVKRLKWNLGSVCLEIVLILLQDRCMVCMEHTICSEINLDEPDGTVDAADGTT